MRAEYCRKISRRRPVLGPSWSRVGATRWYAVFAVDEAGNVSPASNIVSLDQRVPKKGAKAKKDEKNFRAKKGKPDSKLPAPTNFKATYNQNNIIEFSWDPVTAPGLAGYRVAFSDTNPEDMRGYYLELSNQPVNADQHIRTGDMVFVRKSLKDYSVDWMSNRLGNFAKAVRRYITEHVPKTLHMQPLAERTWRLAEHEAGTPVTEPGEYYLEMTLKSGEEHLVGFHGIADLNNSKQDFYPVPSDGAEYIMEVWLKTDAEGNPPVVFTWEGDERVGSFVGSHDLQPGTEWSRHEVRFTGRSSAEGRGAFLVLKVQGAGTYSFDNFESTALMLIFSIICPMNMSS